MKNYLVAILFCFGVMSACFAEDEQGAVAQPTEPQVEEPVAQDVQPEAANQTPEVSNQAEMTSPTAAPVAPQAPQTQPVGMVSKSLANALLQRMIVCSQNANDTDNPEYFYACYGNLETPFEVCMAREIVEELRVADTFRDLKISPKCRKYIG